MDLLGPCTNVFLTAYAHVRTEPQCDIGQTRGKKQKMHVKVLVDPRALFQELHVQDKAAVRDCAQKLPNVTSETFRK